MCRSLASADNSAVVSLRHEHGDQLTCHTGARIRASEPEPWREIRPSFNGFQNRPSFVRFGSLWDSILVASLHAILSLEQLAAFIVQRSSHGSVKLCATSLGGSADINSIAPSGSEEWQ